MGFCSNVGVYCDGTARQYREVPTDCRPPLAMQIKGFATKQHVGRGLYGENCVRCHGPGAVSSGLLPDLRYSSQDVYDNWNGIVLGGMRGMNGMASFADALTLTESNAIRAYVSSRAHREPTVIDWMLKQVADSSLCLPAEWATD